MFPKLFPKMKLKIHRKVDSSIDRIFPENRNTNRLNLNLNLKLKNSLANTISIPKRIECDYSLISKNSKINLLTLSSKSQGENHREECRKLKSLIIKKYNFRYYYKKYYTYENEPSNKKYELKYGFRKRRLPIYNLINKIIDNKSKSLEIEKDKNILKRIKNHNDNNNDNIPERSRQDALSNLNFYEKNKNLQHSKYFDNLKNFINLEKKMNIKALYLNSNLALDSNQIHWSDLRMKYDKIRMLRTKINQSLDDCEYFKSV